MQSVEDLKLRIRSLETERLRLKNELDSLRRSAENRAIALEGDVTAMREELSELREILGSNTAVASMPANVESIKVEPPQQVSPVNSPVAETPAKESSPTSPPPPIAKTPLDSIMDNLSEDELKVVKILQVHEGKYPQKSIRAEAKFSWLQANRIISRLNEQGIVTFEKNGPLDTVVLAEELKINS